MNITFEEPFPSGFFFDKTLTQQLLWNLLTNAVYYSRNFTQVDLHLEYDMLTSRLCVTVRNMCLYQVEAKHFKSLFKPYYRLSESRHLNSFGVGQGLFTCD